MKCDLEDFTFSQTLIRQSSLQIQAVILATEHEKFSVFTKHFSLSI